ncbi:MAG: HEAT repeat domain-containing protein [Phycisphaerales bacterium]|nr:HEAT repeat domain-containing protein [Phycisphaerales bacterium]
MSTATVAATPMEHYRTLDATDRQRLEQASTILQQPLDTVSLDQRTAAVLDLLALDNIDASAIVNTAIVNQSPAALLAVLAAMSEREQLDLDLLPVLLQSLNTAPQGTLEPLGVELARYQTIQPTILSTIATTMLDPTRSKAERIAAIAALAAFRSQGNLAIERVMDVLKNHETEHEEIIEAAMRAASSLTGMPNMQTPDTWTTWWNANRRRSSLDRLRNVIDAMNRRIALQDVEMQQARNEAQRSSSQLIATYQDLIPMLSLEQQLAKLRDLLQDPRSDVRRFAVDRMGVMLQDGHETPELQAETILLLQDPDLNVRRRVAALLGELDHEELETVLVERLNNEQDPEVLQQALVAIEVRPTVTALHPVRRLLSDDAVRDQAARTLLAILQSTDNMSGLDRAAIARGAREAMLSSSDVSIAAILVLTGNDKDLEGLATLLDSEDPDTRVAIAKSLLQRGQRTVLIGHAEDELLYPFALQAASSNGNDTIAKVLELAPPTEALREQWMDTVMTLAVRAPSNRILELDELVGATPHATDILRTRLLSGIIADRELEADLHQRILKRLIPMLLEQDAAASALTHIRGLPEGAIDDDLKALRFISAIRARLYDDASSMQGDPAMWVLAYQDTLASRPESAADLRSEIARRFNDALTAEQRAQLGLVDDPLMQPEDESPPDTESSLESETTP